MNEILTKKEYILENLLCSLVGVISFSLGGLIVYYCDSSFHWIKILGLVILAAISFMFGFVFFISSIILNKYSVLASEKLTKCVNCKNCIRFSIGHGIKWKEEDYFLCSLYTEFKETYTRDYHCGSFKKPIPANDYRLIWIFVF